MVLREISKTTDASVILPVFSQYARTFLRKSNEYAISTLYHKCTVFVSFCYNIAELNLLIEIDLNNQSYQEVKDELINEIAQLDLTITDLQDKVAYLNKVAEVLINLNNSDSENRRLARYDYAKMNLTAAITLEQVEEEIEKNQKSMTKWIDDYEYKVRKLEVLLQTLSHSLSSSDHRDRPSKKELGL